MKEKIILALLFFLVSCSNIRSAYRPDLLTHIKEFEKHCKCKVNIPVYITKINSDSTIGLCYGFKQSILFRYIVLDETYWDESDMYVRE